jgi:hypothetical protein
MSHPRPWFEGLLVALGLLAGMRVGAGDRLTHAPPFPKASPNRWIGPPVTWEGLRGKVVLLDVWTFG